MSGSALTHRMAREKGIALGDAMDHAGSGVVGGFVEAAFFNVLS